MLVDALSFALCVAEEIIAHPLIKVNLDFGDLQIPQMSGAQVGTMLHCTLTEARMVCDSILRQATANIGHQFDCCLSKT